MSRIALIAAFLLAACGPATPEEFAPVYTDAFCSAAYECGRMSSLDDCIKTNTPVFAAWCTSERNPEWDPALAAQCLDNIEAHACGEAEPGENPCEDICGTPF